MGLSRDEAREIAAIALLLTMGLRLLAGVFQLVEEAQRSHDWRSLLGRFLAPVGSTLGVLALALALLLVLSPPGSISMRSTRLSTNLVGLIAFLGGVSVVNGLTTESASWSSSLSFVLINGFAAATLAGAAWWILTNFDAGR